MEIRTATKQETAWISQFKYRGGRGKQPVRLRIEGPVRLRIEAIEDEIAVFDGCCDGTLAERCTTVVQVRSAMQNVRIAFPEKRFSHAHQDGAVYVWKIKG